jgi:hypothetical protein
MWKEPISAMGRIDVDTLKGRSRFCYPVDAKSGRCGFEGEDYCGHCDLVFWNVSDSSNYGNATDFFWQYYSNGTVSDCQKGPFNVCCFIVGVVCCWLYLLFIFFLFFFIFFIIIIIIITNVIN